MPRYRMPDGTTPFAQPGSRRALELEVRGGVPVLDGVELEVDPEAATVAVRLLDGDPDDVLAEAEEFDVDALEALIRTEAQGQNRPAVLAGLQRLRDGQGVTPQAQQLQALADAGFDASWDADTIAALHDEMEGDQGS